MSCELNETFKIDTIVRENTCENHFSKCVKTLEKNICVQQKIFFRKKLFNRVVSKTEIKSIHNLKGFDDFRLISNHFFLFCKSLNNLN